MFNYYENFSREDWKSAPRKVGKLPIVRYIILNEKRTIENDHLTRKINLQNKCLPPLSKWRLSKVRGWKWTYMPLNFLVFILSSGLWYLIIWPKQLVQLWTCHNVTQSQRGLTWGRPSKNKKNPYLCDNCFEAIWFERGFEGIG